MVISTLRLYGLDDQSHAGVPNLLLPLQSLLDQCQASLVLRLVISRILLKGVPLTESIHELFETVHVHSILPVTHLYLGKSVTGQSKRGTSSLWMALECVTEREPAVRPWKPP